jgi:hypothetical protein
VTSCIEWLGAEKTPYELHYDIWVYDIVWEWNSALQKWLVAYAHQHGDSVLAGEGFGSVLPCERPEDRYPMWVYKGPPFLLWQRYVYGFKGKMAWELERQESNWKGGPSTCYLPG